MADLDQDSFAVMSDDNLSPRNLAPAPPQRAGYTPGQRRLHWIVAALVLLQLTVGFIIATVTRDPAHRASLTRLFTLHATVGTLIFLLVVARLRLRQRVGAPPPPAGTPQDAATLARVNHLGFYGLLLALPVLGWLAATAGRPFGSLHGALAIVLVVAIVAHLSGAAYHTYIRRDGLWRRMTSTVGSSPDDDAAGLPTSEGIASVMNSFRETFLRPSLDSADAHQREHRDGAAGPTPVPSVSQMFRDWLRPSLESSSRVSSFRAFFRPRDIGR